jgi:hypothetical protein
VSLSGLSSDPENTAATCDVAARPGQTVQLPGRAWQDARGARPVDVRPRRAAHLGKQNALLGLLPARHKRPGRRTAVRLEYGRRVLEG